MNGPVLIFLFGVWFNPNHVLQLRQEEHALTAFHASVRVCSIKMTDTVNHSPNITFKGECEDAARLINQAVKELDQ
jgi:hypothetical protein